MDQVAKQCILKWATFPKLQKLVSKTQSVRSKMSDFHNLVQTFPSRVLTSLSKCVRSRRAIVEFRLGACNTWCLEDLFCLVHLTSFCTTPRIHHWVKSSIDV